MGKLILLRHGQSAWNKKKIFTGWVDIPLSTEGIAEALRAGERLREVAIDCVFTSQLVRASMTAFLALASSEKIPALCHEDPAYAFPEGSSLLPVIAHEALNERKYGALQGKNKEAIREEFGEKQFKEWRRSYEGTPPEGESLQKTAARVLPYFHKAIFPLVYAGKTVLVVAHGNSLRAVRRELDRLTPEEVSMLEIPTGEPCTYIYSKGDWVR